MTREGWQRFTLMGWFSPCEFDKIASNLYIPEN